MLDNKILQLKLEIDQIKEYVEDEICQRCDKLNKRLYECESSIIFLIEEKIENIKNQIEQVKSEIATEKCNYAYKYKELESLEKQLMDLEKK